MTAGSAALADEATIWAGPLAVETYGCWGDKAIKCLNILAARITTRTVQLCQLCMVGSASS